MSDISQVEIIDDSTDRGEKSREWNSPTRQPDGSLLPVISGDFVSVDEAEKAEIVFTSEGRYLSEQMLAKMMKDNSSQWDPTNIKRIRALYNVDSFAHKLGPFGHYEQDDMKKYPEIFRLACAREYISKGSAVPDGREYVSDSGKKERYLKGFENGWTKVVDTSPYKDEEPDKRPWYIPDQKDSRSPYL